jgi:integrase
MGRSQRTCEDHRDRADHLDRIGGWIAHTPLAKLTATGLDQWLGEYEADAQRRHGVSGRRGRNLYAMAFNVALAWAGNVHRGARKFPNREPMLAPEQARALLTTVLPEDGDGASGGAMDDEPDETIVHGVKTKYSPLELAEARTLLSVLREKRATSEVAPLIEYILLTGERSGAARSLKWKHVDRPAGRITVPAGIRKNRLPLLVPITAALQRLLDAQAGHPMAVDRESYMFPSTAGHTAGVGRVEHKLNGQLSSSCGTIRAECSRIGHPVQRFSPQSLRVTVAVGLSELGVPQETREMVLGDKPQGIVRQHYDQPKAHLSRVQDALEQWHATIGAD